MIEVRVVVELCVRVVRTFTRECLDALARRLSCLDELARLLWYAPEGLAVVWGLGGCGCGPGRLCGDRGSS